MAYQDIDKRIRECKKCGEIKSFNEFEKKQGNNFGIGWTCAYCAKKEYKIYRENNKEKRNKQSKEWREKNKEKFQELKKEYRKNNKSKISKYNKEYREANINHITERQSNQRKNNRKNINKVRRNKYKNNVNYKISANLRSRLRIALKEQNAEKNNKTLDYLGCSITEFKKYIEKQFVDGMSWDNYAYDTWHLDHEFPLSKANLKNEDEIKRVMHYTNFQPLSAFDNISKGNKLNWEPKENQ